MSNRLSNGLPPLRRGWAMADARLSNLNVQSFEAPARVGKAGNLVMLDLGIGGMSVTATMAADAAVALGRLLILNAEELQAAARPRGVAGQS